MNLSTFIHWLHQAVEDAEGSNRHIIRFAKGSDYTAFANLMSRKATASPHLRQVRQLHLIRAISCPLRSIDRIASLPLIHSIESDERIKLHPIDAHLTSLNVHGEPLNAPTATIPWGVKHIGAPQVWPKSKGDRIRIGVIDTGVDFSHPDLSQCLARGVNVLNRQLYPMDDNGHGTHIAGTIAAYTKQHGVIGVAPNALIHPVKAFDNHGGAFVSDIIKGIDWCVLNQMHIINMSFGMKTYSKALEAAILSAQRAGIVVVASSGNEGKQSEVDYPARFRQVISVGATTRKGRIAPFTNIGGRIDIFAPGEKILSTWLRGKYQRLSGTSMATSHVTGVVAMMLALKPGLNPLRVKALLRNHARLIVSPSKKNVIRELHALRAVSAALARKKTT